MEVSTVALACIYFERLCLSGVVTKPNRRLAMAACLAIAYKFNEAVLEGGSKLPALWAFVDQEWQACCVLHYVVVVGGGGVGVGAVLMFLVVCLGCFRTSWAVFRGDRIAHASLQPIT